MTNFDKALDDILLKHGAEQGELHYSLKEAIKQAVEEYVIGEYEEETVLDKTDTLYHFNSNKRRRNKLRAAQRQALLGDG